MLPLIKDRDKWDLVRDRVHEILSAEQANQETLAGADPSVDVNDYRFNILLEHAEPLMLILNNDGQVTEETPIVNVKFDELPFSQEDSTRHSDQSGEEIIFIDTWVARTSKENEPGSKLAAIDAARIAGICRKIIQAEEYDQLKLSAIVDNRMVRSIEAILPRVEDMLSEHVYGIRITLAVRVNETSEKIIVTPINKITAITQNAEGEILAETEYSP